MNPTKIVKDKKFPEMYRLQWADGVVSEDYYNLTRAKDILKNYEEYRRNMKSADFMSALWSGEDYRSTRAHALKMKKAIQVASALK